VTAPVSISRQCRLLGINRAHIYYRPQPKLDDTFLLNRISEIYTQRPAYGYRKIGVILREEGHAVNKKKVLKLMRMLGIQSILPKPNLSEPAKVKRSLPYLLEGLLIYKPNQVWAIDITYIRLPTGMVYLFAVIDWYSRYIVGWVLTNTLCAEHALSALNKALKYGKPDIFNADQGAQFTSDAWCDELMRLNIQISHDGVGRCIDNIRIERFWRTIKYEDIHLNDYRTIGEARAGISRFMAYYNNERPHQALHYNRPRDVYFNSVASYACPGHTEAA